MSRVEILAHRGWWRSKSDQNSLEALCRAFDAGFGVETDVRDHAGRLVVSHDIPKGVVLDLDELLERYVDIPQAGRLALNIKADGLSGPLLAALRARSISNFFVFDMSVPDTLPYLAAGAPVFTRRSEYEAGSALDRQAEGLWLDAFVASAVPSADIAYAENLQKSFALVSPELHRKPHLDAWVGWRETMTRSDRGAQRMICTDFPEEANMFFNESKGRGQ